MKLGQVKEFCRMKQLDRGPKAKLIAHYEHLYPENVIVDEKEILYDLPPRMREELVKTLYGTIITSIPIFFGQDTMVLTELCMALTHLPALKGELIVREGQRGHEMYSIEKGVCRVSQKFRVNDDVSRVKTWIEETFQATGIPVALFDSNLRTHLEELLRRMRYLAKKKKSSWTALDQVATNLRKDIDGLKAAAGYSNPRSTESGLQERQELELKTKEIELAANQAKLERLTCKQLTYKDVDDDDIACDVRATFVLSYAGVIVDACADMTALYVPMCFRWLPGQT
jgi:hypothetical protein